MNCGVLDEDIVMSGCIETDEDSFDMDKDTFEIKELELCALEQVWICKDQSRGQCLDVPRCDSRGTTCLNVIAGVSLPRCDRQNATSFWGMVRFACREEGREYMCKRCCLAVNGQGM